MSYENKIKTYRTHVVSTTRGGKARSMDWWSSEKAQLQMTTSRERDAVKYSPK